jgi:hypothetical protein
MDNTPLPIMRIFSRPTIGILFSVGTYLCGLWSAAEAPRVLAPGGTREFVVVGLPLLTLLLLVGLLYFLYLSSDEYIRQRTLKSATLTAVILAFSTTAYFCLEQLGFPRLSMIVANVCGWTLFSILLLWVLHRAR